MHHGVNTPLFLSIFLESKIFLGTFFILYIFIFKESQLFDPKKDKNYPSSLTPPNWNGMWVEKKKGVKVR
jgi:hypothetical protein